MRVLPATVGQLTALRDDRDAFGELIGSPAPAGWPEFPEAIEFTIDKLTGRPDEAQWWMHFFLADGLGLVGSGGFVGPPQDGAVEIGYEIAPEFRNRGLATAAATAMIDKALAGGVHTVVAHTLAHVNPSTGVLSRLGFRRTAEFTDPDDGPVWRWELTSQT